MKAESKPVPGDIFVRPTRAGAERDWPDFHALLDALRGPETLPLRKIAEVAGDTSLNPEPNILRKIQNRTLGEDARRLILRHIFDDAQLLSGAGRKRLGGRTIVESDGIFCQWARKELSSGAAGSWSRGRRRWLEPWRQAMSDRNALASSELLGARGCTITIEWP